jgi:hypothetical protein
MEESIVWEGGEKVNEKERRKRNGGTGLGFLP